jgi:hypothetical protein
MSKCRSECGSGTGSGEEGRKKEPTSRRSNKVDAGVSECRSASRSGTSWESE